MRYWHCFKQNKLASRDTDSLYTSFLPMCTGRWTYCDVYIKGGNHDFPDVIPGSLAISPEV